MCVRVSMRVFACVLVTVKGCGAQTRNPKTPRSLADLGKGLVFLGYEMERHGA